MAQYIDKDALVEYIKFRYLEHQTGNQPIGCLDRMKEDKAILSYLNTLEVKEVDLEKELQDHIRECLDIKFPTTDIELIKKDVEYTARKFFELGLKTRKGE